MPRADTIVVNATYWTLLVSIHRWTLQVCLENNQAMAQRKGMSSVSRGNMGT